MRAAVFLALVAWCAQSATADDGTSALVMAVARVSANEGAMWAEDHADVDLIWQVVRTHSDTTRGRLAWLRKHSGRVLQRKPCKRGNCLWSRHLTRLTGVIPAGLAAGKGDWWLAEAEPRWQGVLARTRALVRDGVESSPCPAPPETWGGRNIDMEQALSRGLYPLGCDPRALNEGFRYGYVGSFAW